MVNHIDTTSLSFLDGAKYPAPTSVDTTLTLGGAHAAGETPQAQSKITIKFTENHPKAKLTVSSPFTADIWGPYDSAPQLSVEKFCGEISLADDGNTIILTPLGDIVAPGDL